MHASSKPLLLPLVSCAVLLLSAVDLHAGWAFPSYPSIDETICDSHTIAWGEVTKIHEIETRENDRQRVTKFDIQVHETIYGEAKAEKLTLVEGDTWSQPKLGDKAIVAISAPWRKTGSRWDRVENVRRYCKVKSTEDATFVFWRNIARVYEMPSVAEQAAEVTQGCFSPNSGYRNWCLGALAGSGSNLSTGGGLKVHEHVPRPAAWTLMRRVQAEFAADRRHVLRCDYYLTEDKNYVNSDARYQLLLGLLADLRPGKFENLHEFRQQAKLLRTAFPARALETIAQLEAFINNDKCELRGVAILEAGDFYLDAQPATRKRLLALLTSRLGNGEDALDDFAATALGATALSAVRAGKTAPHEILNLLDGAPGATVRATAKLNIYRQEFRKLTAPPLPPRGE